MALPQVILEYQFSTFPAQLQVSTAAAEATGRINVSVSSGGTPRYCSQIQVSVPIGADPTDFSAATPTAAVNTANWTLSSQAIVSGSDLGLDSTASYASFTFDAKDPSVYKIDYNLVLSLTGVVNDLVGRFGVVVDETSGTDAGSLTHKRSTFPLDKVPPYFYLENFVAATTASSPVPATEFANGEDIRLAWESNGTWFELYEKNKAKPIYSCVDKTFTVKGGAATDTTYVLRASLTGDPGDDAGGFEPIYLYDSLTVTISNPDLTPKTAVVAGALHASGGGTIDGRLGLCSAPDYSKGTVSIGLRPFDNCSLHVENDQSEGYAIFVNAPSLSGSSWALLVSGRCANLSGSWSTPSDVRLKERVQPFDDGLAHVLRINPVRHHYKEETGLGSKHEYVGVSAQEIQEFAPYMVGKTRLRPDSDEEYLCTDNGAMTYMLVNAVKELKAEIDALKADSRRRAREVGADREGNGPGLFEKLFAMFRRASLSRIRRRTRPRPKLNRRFPWLCHQ